MNAGLAIYAPRQQRSLSLRNRDTRSLFHFRRCCTSFLGKRVNSERKLAQPAPTTYEVPGVSEFITH